MAAGNETLTTLSNVLKTKYDQKRINIMAYEDDYFLSTVRKDTKFGGNNARITLRYGSPQGGSNDITKAIANKTSSTDAGFLLTRAHDYHVCSMDAEAMLAGEGEENTVLNALDSSMDGGMRMIRTSLEVGVYGDGTGKRGNIDLTTVLTGTVITLADPTSIVNFEKDMKIAFFNPTGPAIRNAGATLTITACDRDNGKITVSAAINTVTGTTNGDGIVRDGDFNTHIKGLSGWLPLVPPTAGDNWFGVDRSDDTTRKAGVRWAGGGAQKVETLVKATVRLSREGGKDGKRIGLLNIEDLGDLAIGLGAKAEYDPVKTIDGTFGFQSLKINTPRGTLPLYGSLRVTKGEFYILQPDTWVLKSIKGAPHVVDDDGVTMLREPNSDAVTWRLRYFAQLGCEAPGWNLHGTF